MNNRPEIDRYVLTEMDEEGNVWCDSGKNNFSFQGDRPAGQFSGIQNSHARTGVHVRSGRIQTAFSTIFQGENHSCKSD